ncbi:hypothetical protein A0H81_10634 [Grifola frondosa]|uniref:Uncharacterized protein n=1 Tax=Grifola frondosa TaxID=5627 RepID=A0A1C7LXJ6_GRIFR|nr:hypothetical protein A0H81_10634 [Grifola frondosa]
MPCAALVDHVFAMIDDEGEANGQRRVDRRGDTYSLACHMLCGLTSHEVLCFDEAISSGWAL